MSEPASARDSSASTSAFWAEYGWRSAPNGRDVLGEQSRQARIEPVGRYRGGVDEPAGLGRDRGLEDVAGAGQVDLTALPLSGDDHEGQVDDDVGAGHQRLDGFAVEDVAPAVLDLLPAMLGRVEGTAGHAEDAPHSVAALQRGEEWLADLSSGPGDRDGEHRENRSSGVALDAKSANPLRVRILSRR